MAVETGSQPPPTETTEKGPATSRALASGAWTLVKRFLTLREGSVIVITVLTILYFSVTLEQFATSGNFKTLLPYFAPVAILAAGEVFLMINGEIDLSIGAVYLFAPFIFYEFNNGGIPLIASLILAILACMVIGLINGLFTAVVGINSFITTLGMLFTVSGFTLIISHAQPVDTPGTDVAHVTTFARIFGAGTYSELIWALAIIIVLQILLTLTRWGLYTVAVGGNRLGAAEAGVKVRLVDHPQLHPLQHVRRARRRARGGAHQLGPARSRRRQLGPLRRRSRPRSSAARCWPAARARSSAR